MCLLLFGSVCFSGIPLFLVWPLRIAPNAGNIQQILSDAGCALKAYVVDLKWFGGDWSDLDDFAVGWIWISNHVTCLVFIVETILCVCVFVGVVILWCSCTMLYHVVHIIFFEPSLQFLWSWMSWPAAGIWSSNSARWQTCWFRKHLGKGKMRWNELYDHDIHMLKLSSYSFIFQRFLRFKTSRSQVIGYHVAPVEFLGIWPPFEDLVLKIAGCASIDCDQSVNASHIVVNVFPATKLHGGCRQCKSVGNTAMPYQLERSRKPNMNELKSTCHVNQRQSISMV